MAALTVGRRMRREFHQMLDAGSVQTIYQPVVPIAGMTPVGYEALSRGPVASLTSPVTLFEVAAHESSASRLDALCCRRAIANFPLADQNDVLLFINVLPESLEMDQINRDRLCEWTDEAGLAPNRVVLEVTEKQMTDPSRFYSQVAKLRQAGFRFAVDDVGTGYSNLSLLTDLVPEFFKLDLDFVRLTRVRPVRQMLVESLVRFSGQIGAMVVAEGIESSADAEVFRLLGVQLAQGFLYRIA